MKALVVYCHPSENSFSAAAKDVMSRFFEDNDIEYQISDLYGMNFVSELSAEEYDRECRMDETLPVSEDVRLEQEKIQWADYIFFLFPLFWNDVPAKMKGWFDRVWTYGFAYGPVLPDGTLTTAAMTQKKAIIYLCSTGNSMEGLNKSDKLKALRTTLLVDRIYDRARLSEVVVFDQLSHDNPDYERNKIFHLERLKQSLETFFEF